ncbi:MAG: right-handed parallel beta-helix repeat-containing protein [Candidatus Thermoplasmatota archaeon]|nr:right-handed parallel beta-helix repeat-containing protein [Candidatus Thermoplasmatota archaeon]
MRKYVSSAVVSCLLVMTALLGSTSEGATPVDHQNDGTLSGYVNDTAMQPLEGARVRVSFHETYEEDYTDASGYYHVTNIPICYCLKNATASKSGYEPDTVWLGITENTTLDFMLTRASSTYRYVGGTGPGNYSSIQQAINEATTNDIIYVYDDSSPYYETIIVNRSIHLIGENKETTVIDGCGQHTVVKIVTNNNVHLSGFTIQNSTRVPSHRDDWRGRGIEILAACYCEITNNIIRNNDIGILLHNYVWSYYTHTNAISHNEITQNTNGITLGYGSWDTTVSHNNIQGNWYGICIRTQYSNTIHSNNIMRNWRWVLLWPEISWPDGPALDEIDHNIWTENYWGSPRPLKIIFGRAAVSYDHAFWYERYLECDRTPAQQPYEL